MQAIRNLQGIFNSVKSSPIFNAVRSTSSSQPSEYINAHLANGVGRYMCQLQRITFKFCKEHSGSSGLRFYFFLICF